MFLERSSNAVCPEELLGDGTFWDIAQVFQEGSLLEVYIHAVAEAGMSVLCKDCVLVYAEWVLDSATALLVASQRHKTHLLSKAKCTEGVLDLSGLGLELLSCDLHGRLSNGFHI